MMDDARLIAWIDGHLEPAEARRVAAEVAADPALAARAETHRKLKARVFATFGPLLAEVAAVPPRKPAPVISLAEAPAQRRDRATGAGRATVAAAPVRRAWPGAIAVAVLIGILAVHQIGQAEPLATGPRIGDHVGALALAPELAQALDTQAAGQAGPLRVAQSFRDQSGAYCRSFVSAHLRGVACRGAEGWLLRYGLPVGADGDGSVAGGDTTMAHMVQAMIAGAPLDPGQEQAARATAWK
jgi:hypothetical protein